MTRKGIILAGGSGTRLYPVTQVVIEAAPAGVRQADDLLSAVDADARGHPRHPAHLARRRTRRASRSCWATARSGGSTLSLRGAAAPDGLAQAFVIGRDFVGRDACALVLGDNIFYGHDLHVQLARANARADGCDGVRLPGRRSRALRRRRVRRARAACCRLEEKPAQPQVALRGDRPLLLRQPRARHRARAQAVGARRARDHRRQPRLPRVGRARRAR